MTIKMKALRSFHGAGEGRVKRGREFEVRDINRAKEIEAHGLGYRIESAAKAEPALQNKMTPVPQNKAAEQGPFDSVGGGTGEAAPAPSSAPVLRRSRRQSSSSADDLLS